jgi:hypothetical protein
MVRVCDVEALRCLARSGGAMQRDAGTVVFCFARSVTLRS